METFMVRVWRPGDGERPDGVRGVAVHLGSGRELTFSEPDRLIAFLGEATAVDERPASMQRASQDLDRE
jgi:hypothetical protein